MSPRQSVEMSEAEVAAFLRERHTMSLATTLPDGRIHLAAIWYGFVDGDVGFFTYRGAQKTRNLERDPSLSCMVERGDTYDELRGVTLIGRGEFIEDDESRVELGYSTTGRYEGELTDEDRARIRRGIHKRTAVRVHVDRVISWDHRKLAG